MGKWACLVLRATWGWFSELNLCLGQLRLGRIDKTLQRTNSRAIETFQFSGSYSTHLWFPIALSGMIPHSVKYMWDFSVFNSNLEFNFVNFCDCNRSNARTKSFSDPQHKCRLCFGVIFIHPVHTVVTHRYTKHPRGIWFTIARHEINVSLSLLSHAPIQCFTHSLSFASFSVFSIFDFNQYNECIIIEFVSVSRFLRCVCGHTHTIHLVIVIFAAFEFPYVVCGDR